MKQNLVFYEIVKRKQNELVYQKIGCYTFEKDRQLLRELKISFCFI